MPSRRGTTGRDSPLEPRQEERTSHHRSRRHDKERERSRSPQDRLISKTSQDYERDESGKERRRRERERTDRKQGEEGHREEPRRREGEKGDRRWKLEGEREDQPHREEGKARREDRERDRQREERGKRERRQREEGERSDERQREEERWEGTRKGEKEVGGRRMETDRHREGERTRGEKRQDVEVEHITDQTTKRDEDRKRRREVRMAEDEEAKNYEFGGSQGPSKEKEDKDSVQKEEPNFALSGKLTAETNTYKGVVIKYSEPAEARQPTTRWRLYQFKGEEVLPTLYIHRQSAYLIGRDRRVVDLPVDHPSCSSQHAVLQYRLVNYEKKDGSTGKRVRPYLIDLESTNGTYINNQRIESARYWELKEKDMIKFGFSSREYILLHENSQDMDAVS